MIRAPRIDTSATVTTSQAHVMAVARKVGTKPIPIGPYLYCVRSVPLLGRPLIYRCRVEVQP
jgi:hypothetical protein